MVHGIMASPVCVLTVEGVAGLYEALFAICVGALQ